jgi:hypothetical protein
MHRLAAAALAAIAVASAGSALAADGPGTIRHGAPPAVGSNIPHVGGVVGQGGGVPIVDKPHCPAGSISCGKQCRPAGSSCPKV